MASPILREKTRIAAKVSMHEAGCHEWANRIAGSMPAIAF